MLLQFRGTTEKDVTLIATFLRENGLAVSGVEKCWHNFIIATDRDGSWIGIAGFEQFGQNCLLRSVAVNGKFRGRGYGRALVERILAKAQSKGAKLAYLLTEDASEYFERFGFKVIDRNDVDEAVKASLEFTESSCETAAAMLKSLD